MVKSSEPSSPMTAKAYPSFCSIKRLVTPPGQNASPTKVSVVPGSQYFVRFPDSLLVSIFTPRWKEAL